MRVGAGGEFGLEALVGLAIVESGDALLPCLDLYQHLRQVAVRSRTADHRNIGCAFENLFAFLLGHAAQHAKLFSLGMQFFVVGEAMENFLLGFVADGAGVVEDQAGIFDSRDLTVALGNERADNFFGVVHVHLAAESFEVESLLGLGRHIRGKYNARRGK